MALLQPAYVLNVPPVLHSDEDDGEDILISICSKIEAIVNGNPAVDSIHVYTHAGDDPKGESNMGKFVNRGNYNSVFRRLNAIDDFVDSKESFDFEKRLTLRLAEKYPYVRDAVLEQGSVVMTTKAHGKGSFSPGTRVYVSLGQCLMKCLLSGTIVMQEPGLTMVVNAVTDVSLSCCH